MLYLAPDDAFTGALISDAFTIRTAGGRLRALSENLRVFQFTHGCHAACFRGGGGGDCGRNRFSPQPAKRYRTTAQHPVWRDLEPGAVQSEGAPDGGRDDRRSF